MSASPGIQGFGKGVVSNVLSMTRRGLGRINDQEIEAKSGQKDAPDWVETEGVKQKTVAASS